ncbi:hypothetical protein EAH77_15735 [Ewingella americana]|uniref:Uncharacterized protein n=1 Tax=Ewingella americana TaxID=41202 RepID=A0A502GCL8_9GAMM|nr:hypothetical protein EAH77_15735 [Ewingella americana]
MYFKDTSKTNLVALGDALIDQNNSLFKVIEVPEKIVNGSTITVEGVNYPLISTLYASKIQLGGVAAPIQRTISGKILATKLIDPATMVVEVTVNFPIAAKEDIGLIQVGSIFVQSPTSSYQVTQVMEQEGHYQIKTTPGSSNVGTPPPTFTVDISEPFSLDAPTTGNNVPEIFITNVSASDKGKKVLLELEDSYVQAIVRRFQSGTGKILVEVTWIDRLGLQYTEADVRVNDQKISLIKPQADSHTYKGYISLDNFKTGELKATLGTGESHAIQGEVITQVPAIDNAKLLGLGYGQTALKVNDILQIQVTTDSEHPVRLEIQSNDFSLIDETLTPVNGVVVCKLRSLYSGTQSKDVDVKLRLLSVFGYNSEWANTTSKVTLRNVPPAVSLKEVIYPKGQRAIKGTYDLSEYAFISLNIESATHLRFRHVNPESTKCEFDEEGFVSVVECTKPDGAVGARIFVDPSWEENCLYQNNIEVIAYNKDINKETRCLIQVNVANLPLQAVLSGTGKSLISGGNNGTPIQVHKLGLVVNQELLQTPTLDVPLALIPTFDKVSDTEWTLNLTVHDDDARGIVRLSKFEMVNLAGITIKNPSNTDTLAIGGFVRREFKIRPYPYRESYDRLGVDIVEPSNLVASHFGLGAGLTIPMSMNKVHDEESCTLIDATTGKPNFKRGSRVYNNHLDTSVGNTTGNLVISIEELPYDYSYLTYNPTIV